MSLIKVSDYRFEAAITKQESDSTEPRHYGWTLWKAKVPVKKGQVNSTMDITLQTLTLLQYRKIRLLSQEPKLVNCIFT